MGDIVGRSSEPRPPPPRVSYNHMSHKIRRAGRRLRSQQGLALRTRLRLSIGAHDFLFHSLCVIFCELLRLPIAATRQLNHFLNGPDCGLRLVELDVVTAPVREQLLAVG